MLAVFLALAPTAIAQEEDGVFVDPGSPTGKEYAIPFDSARRDAAPSDGGSGAAPETAPLFGAGITSPGGSNRENGQAANAASERRSSKKRSPAADAEESPASSEAAEILEAATQNPGAPAGGLDAPIIVALLAAGLLLVGGLAGLVVRRGRG